MAVVRKRGGLGGSWDLLTGAVVTVFDNGSMRRTQEILFAPDGTNKKNQICRISQKDDCAHVGYVNTFGYDKVLNKGWEEANDWTESHADIDVFSKKLIFVPSK